jgi:cellulose biosynthesis protein BcsQ
MKMSSRDAMISGNNPNVVRNNIHFSRKKNKSKVFVLVEGTGDVGFYKNIIDKNNVQIIPMGDEKKKESAKDSVIQTIEFLNHNRVQGVVAIVDTDYDAIAGKIQEIENLIYTDDHDIETMILKTDAYEKFENEYIIVFSINRKENTQNVFQKTESMYRARSVFFY